MKKNHAGRAGARLASALRSGAFALAGLAILGSMPGIAQMQGGPPTLPPGNPPKVFPGPMSPRPMDPALAKLQHRQAQARNMQRQKDLVSDTDKLLDLAKQLKEAVEKSNKDTLSVEVIKKADEIQKLAKSISSKMKAE